MKLGLTCVLVLCFAVAASAQSASPTPYVRPRVAASPTPAQTPRPAVAPTTQPTPRPFVAQTPLPPRVVIVTATPRPIASPYSAAAPIARPTVSPTPVVVPTPGGAVPGPTPFAPSIPAPTPFAVAAPRVGLLAYNQIQARQAEARRLLTTRPAPTFLGSTAPLTSIVTLALLEPRTNQIHTVTIPKTTFLIEGNQSRWATSLGKNVSIRTVRSNYVNTAVAVFDDAGASWIPLIVQYPIEKYGGFQEMAYYASAHPALLSSDVSKAGQLYVRTTIEVALKRLRERGKYIAPQAIAGAERLCVVEHVDHQRFNRESQAALYDEVFTLFALNQGSTYRYSVSSAGAGGMVQMIPATYRMVRSMHPTVPLMPDFVTGMRDHTNAMQAMLLYMHDTWIDLISNQTINEALTSGIATEEELVAAGYNSNPARLASYIRRGGSNWRVLIPRETQMYLQIQRSVMSNVKPLPIVK